MKKFIHVCIVAVAALVLSSSMALAGMSLDDAKVQGLVGEQTDGLIGAVSSASPDVKKLISETNDERLEKYKAIAAKNGTELKQVQALAGKSLISRTPSGQYIKNASGGWQQK